LPDAVLRKHLLVDAGQLRRVFGVKDLPAANRPHNCAFRKDKSSWSRLPAHLAPADTNLVILESSDQCAPEAEKIAGPKDELLHELIKVSNRSKLRSDAHHLVKLMRLRARFGVKLGIGDGDRGKAGHNRQQCFLFRAEWPLATGINENCAF